MRALRYVIILGGLIAFSSYLGGLVSAEVFNRIVAIVNEDVITLYELNKRIKELTGLAPNDLKRRSEEEYLATRRQVLELLMDEKIAQRKIDELGIKISRNRVDTTIERVKEENGWTQEDLLRMLKDHDTTIEEYKEKIRKELERVELINHEVKSKIVIREEEIKKYYEDHKDQYRTEQRVHLAGIFLVAKSPGNKEEMAELRKRGNRVLLELRKGGDFATMARRYSRGPGADEGGNLGVFKLGQLDHGLREVLKDLREGDHSGLIRRPSGYQIIKLLKREGGQVKRLEEVRDAIYRILYRQEIDLLYTSWIKELRASSYRKINF